MTFDDFQHLAESAGLRARCLNNGIHWQLCNGVYTVNYYPTRGTIYLHGYAHKVRGTPADAVRYAREGLSTYPAARRKNNYRKLKRRLLKATNVCFWCGAALTEKTATIEHKIPLSRGGSNGYDNLCLACRSCNHKRGDRLPHERFEKTAGTARRKYEVL